MARDRAERLARGILAGEINIAAGTRALARLCYGDNEWIPIAFAGIASELDDVPSLLYVGVLAIGFIGAIIARLQPRGLARALFATALAQLLVGAIALKLPNTASSVQIVIVHGAFVALFAGAALLFRYAARKGFRPRAWVVG